MKLLLWACILCVVFTEKTFFHVREKFLTSGKKDYSGNHYPLNPSLNIPYPTSVIDFAPLLRPSEKKIPNYPGNPDPDTGVPTFPWILTSPGAPYHRFPNIPVTAWFMPSPPPQESPHFVPNSHRPEGPFLSSNAPLPTAAEPYVATPHVTTRTTPPPCPEPVAVEHGAVEPDDGEPAAAELHTSTSLD